jgi:hypothetical protein
LHDTWESTEIAFAAIRAEDLDALTAALDARAKAIEAGAVPTPEIVERGESMIAALADFKQKLAIENALLQQVRMGYLGSLGRTSPDG